MRLLVPLVLLVVAVLAAGPQWTVDVWRGTEGRRAQIAVEMYETGRLLEPTLNGERTLAKPPLHYWAVVAAQHLFGPSKAALRAPSVVAFWLLAWLAFVTLRRIRGTDAAWIGALGILTSPVVVEAMPQVEIDPVFAAVAAASLLLLAEGAVTRRRFTLIAAGLLAGTALLVKGPPFLLFLFGAVAIWWRRRDLRGGLWFVVPMLALPLAYYVPLVVHLGGVRELIEVAEVESVGRVTTFEWRHIAETPAYWCRAVLCLLPLGLWTFHEFRGEQERREATVADVEVFLRICAGAAIGAILVLTFFPSRPTRYLLPAVPLFVVAVAPAVASWVRAGTLPTVVDRKLLAGLGLLAAATLVVVPFFPLPFPVLLPLFLVPAALIADFARTRTRLVVCVLGLPLLAVWTVLPWRVERQTYGLRDETGPAVVLREELQRHDVAGLATYGHVPSPILLAANVHALGDELRSRPPVARYVLAEVADDGVAVAADLETTYLDLVRIRLSGKNLVLHERR